MLGNSEVAATCFISRRNKHTHTRQIGLINFLVNYSPMLWHCRSYLGPLHLPWLILERFVTVWLLFWLRLCGNACEWKCWWKDKVCEDGFWFEANENLLFSLTQNIRFLFELAYEDDIVANCVHFAHFGHIKSTFTQLAPFENIAETCLKRIPTLNTGFHFYSG